MDAGCFDGGARLGREEFLLDDMYAREGELAKLHPANRHVRDKIRQQLQVLRDKGLLEFLGRGKYRLVGSEFRNGIR